MLIFATATFAIITASPLLWMVSASLKEPAEIFNSSLIPQHPSLQLAIASFQGQYSAAWNYIMAASVVVALPTLVLFFLFQRQLVESIKTSGIK